MASKNETIEIRPIKFEQVHVRIKGDTPLIMHAWSEKAKREMLEKQMKATKTSARAVRNPIEDFINSMYWLSGKPTEYTEEAFEKAIANGATFGFPVTAIKQAGNASAYRLGWVKNQMGLRGAYFINGDENQMVQIHSEPPVMREDMVTIGIGGTDLRYRGEFRNWYADLVVNINTSTDFTIEQILNVINAGGCVCGIGEWRPEKDGQYGMYHVDVE